MRIITLSPLHLLVIFVFLPFLLSLASGEGTCDVEGNCPSEGDETKGKVSPTNEAKQSYNKKKTELVQGTCVEESSSIYGQGGSAQAYKPNAPLSSVVCTPETADLYKYKTASWYISRSNYRKGSAPQLDITLKLLSCSSSLDGGGGECACHRLVGPTVASNIVEVWQTLPDGTYSSLRNSDECRAQVQVDGSGQVRFSTVAPGSTGLMGGLGPSGWDWSPFGPPVIHILVHVAGHEPLLLDLPLLLRLKTLTERGFSLGDWRGVGWMKQKPSASVMKLSSWEPNLDENSIKIEFEISLQKSESDVAVQLCEYMQGLPGSFFLEPITVCSPSTLDFFAL